MTSATVRQPLAASRPARAVPVPPAGPIGRQATLREPLRVCVVGGGLAGLAAATVLAERGARVTLLEREPFLGGRLGAWGDRLADGTPFEMERGFHAFFRQYYNLRALIRRANPDPGIFMSAGDYPILTGDGGMESFAGLPDRPPFNVAALTLRTRSLRLRDLARVNKRIALEMLRFRPDRTFAEWDGTTAGAYLDALAFPPRARERLLHVFAHSCFNPQEQMSAAELLQMFHFYFTGNRDGLIFDIATRPFSHGIVSPLATYLRGLGAEIGTGTAVRAIRRQGGHWMVGSDAGDLPADGIVLATHVPGLRSIVAASEDLDDVAWRGRVAALEITRPFAVWRLWLDRPAATGRHPFAGTAGVGRLDNVSLYHLFEDESRAWAGRTGGAVVELHAYALADIRDEAALRRELLAGLHTIYPEFREARILEERFLIRADCPAFPPGGHAQRPGVATPWDDIALAGDHIRLDFPTALMERAAASGIMAANVLLGRHDVRPEPLWSVPPRGVLA